MDKSSGTFIKRSISNDVPFLHMRDALINSFKKNSKQFAVNEAGQRLSYKELHERAGKIEQYLLALNIRNKWVAINVKNGIDHISAMTGIILSGNYYISVTDENRIGFEAGAMLPIRIVISDCAENIYPDGHAILLTDIFSCQSEKGELQVALHPGELDSTSNLCAFFTSGSTSKPKIVVQTQRNILADTFLQIIDNDITASDKLDLVFSIGFSASLSCIFPALLAGAELCIYNLKEDGIHGLIRFWDAWRITYSTLAVSTFHSICRFHHSLKHLTCLRFVSLSAEPANSTTINYFKTRFLESVVLEIAYATTETRSVSSLKIYNNDRDAPFINSVGRPENNKDVYILSEDNSVLPAGETGEIVVESEYIASEYFGDPEETARVFSRKGSIIVYKTGDNGYFNDQGYLFYAGRKHNEVKINGVKVYLLYTEKVILDIPEISNCVVVINRSLPEMPVITAFYNSPEFNISDIYIKQQLESKLPASHIPRKYIFLEHFPLTHTGKIDRKKLEVFQLDSVKISVTETQPEENFIKTSIINILKKIFL